MHWRHAWHPKKEPPHPTSRSPRTRATTVSLHYLKGKPVVLYFYPRDDTPGCTKQACGIRDAWGEFEKRGAVVLGVSPDSETSHVKFKRKFGLPFTLLADPDHATAEDVRRLGREDELRQDVHGRRALDVRDRRRRELVKVMRKVKPDTHADDVLAVLPENEQRGLRAPSACG